MSSDQLSTSSQTEARPEPQPDGWTIAKSILREIVETIILTLIIFFFIQLVVRNFRVEGHSMAPNLQPGQYLVVDRISYKLFSTPKRGDVIIFTPPNRDDRDYVKRVIGLSGEEVAIRQGKVFINDTLLDEPFGADLDQSSLDPLVVPAGHVFVLGDNRANSNDSRHWKTLAIDRIIGRAWLSYWPPHTWGFIPRDRPSNSGQFFNISQ